MLQFCLVLLGLMSVSMLVLLSNQVGVNVNTCTCGKERKEPGYEWSDCG